MALPEKPITRKETYLAKIAGQEVQIPDVPITREESYLDEIAKNGGGGGGYVLPTATASRLGGVKIGSGISVEEDGTISASGGGGGTYADLPDKPSINGNELSGNKTGAQLGLQNTLTFDNVPTANSTNPVKSGGVYDADEAIRKWTTAEAKSVSGNPITLTDGSERNAEGLAVTCNPKQDLHGYDHPWAGGAGKNKLPLTVAGIKNAMGASEWSGNSKTISDVTFTILTDSNDNVTGIKVNGTASETIIVPVCSYTAFNGTFVLNGCPSGGGYDVFRLDLRDNVGGVLAVDTGSGADAVAMSGTGYYVTIRIQNGYNMQNKVFTPMIRLSTVSDATFEPYTNECPITGYTECVVDRDGKNLLDESQLSSGNLAYLPIYVGSGDFTLSSDAPLNTGSTANLFLLTGNVSVGINTNTNGVWNGQSRTVTATDGYVTIASRNLDGVNPQDYHTMLERGTSSSPYVPYSHDNVILAFGQTVYGGSVNFKTGKVTVTYAIVSIPSLTWEYVATYNRFVCTEIASSIKPPTSDNDIINAICSALKPEKYSTIGNADADCFIVSGTTGNLSVRFKQAGTDATAFTTAMAGQTICYELATPTELTLTPAELELLKGYNYITSNGTTIALVYLPDSLLAEAENYVDDVVDALTNVTSGTFTGLLGFTFTWAKYGKIVSFYARNDTTKIPQGNTIIGDIPDNILPITTQTFDCNRSFANKCSFIITLSTKKISIYCDIPTGSSSPYYVQGNVIYICN